ncbi:hypothetical protein PBI_MIMI_45 [Arthrobacter phage Mimi]|nr:hypothetical protein PBI_MIMI_125 [Arthrobacter phage Mimi]
MTDNDLQKRVDFLENLLRQARIHEPHCWYFQKSEKSHGETYDFYVTHRPCDCWLTFPQKETND